MNKSTGYNEITLADGKTIELKFCNGTTEIYGELTGLKNLTDIEDSLAVPYEHGFDENGNPAQVPSPTTDYLKCLRLYVYAAALYAARVQGKPVTFNEWDPAEWIEEVGTAAILNKEPIPQEQTETAMATA